MKTISVNTLYTAAEVHDLVGATLFDKIKHVALCRDHYLGLHILAALDSLTADAVLAGHEPATDTRVAHSGRKGGAKRENARTCWIDFDQVKLP